MGNHVALPLLLASLLLPVTALPAGAADKDARALIDAYNQRDFGQIGWREVLLAMQSHGETTRSFTIINLWERTDRQVDVLFFLLAPKGLKGTSYLLTEERENRRDMRVHLFLPSGRRRVISIAPSRFGEGLLGSDFSYADMRMLIPTTGFDYELTGDTTLLDKKTWVVEARPTTDPPSVSWSRAHFFLAEPFPFLLGCDTFTGNETEPSKSMRVTSMKKVDGIWTATEMVMTARDGNRTVLSLRDFSVLPRLAPGFLDKDRLPGLADHPENLAKASLLSDSP